VSSTLDFPESSETPEVSFPELVDKSSEELEFASSKLLSSDTPVSD